MPSQEELETQAGPWEGLLGLMRKTRIPVTRENYLKLLHLGKAPKHLTPEQEEELPPELRKEPEIHTEHRE